jgi:hypothetical protein
MLPAWLGCDPVDWCAWQLAIMEFPSLPPASAESPTELQEVLLARTWLLLLLAGEVSSGVCFDLQAKRTNTPRC